ncbi:hypothetical protein B9Z91_007095 [Morganella morganii subsp. morganii]|nr:hypothetical protein B9Z91_007095 [Morganella morganii subsp. morganii]
MLFFINDINELTDLLLTAWKSENEPFPAMPPPRGKGTPPGVPFHKYMYKQWVIRLMLFLRYFLQNIIVKP